MYNLFASNDRGHQLDIQASLNIAERLRIHPHSITQINSYIIASNSKKLLANKLIVAEILSCLNRQVRGKHLKIKKENVMVFIQDWLDHVEIRDRNLAHRLCKLIPAQCPFERNVKLFGRILFHIPPMCKLNPLYDQLVGLRFRALCYLAEIGNGE